MWDSTETKLFTLDELSQWAHSLVGNLCLSNRHWIVKEFQGQYCLLLNDVTNSLANVALAAERLNTAEGVWGRIILVTWLQGVYSTCRTLVVFLRVGNAAKNEEILPDQVKRLESMSELASNQIRAESQRLRDAVAKYEEVPEEIIKLAAMGPIQ